MINSYGHGGEEEICDEEKENEYFDESKKEKIVEVVSAHEDEEFVIQEEISCVIEEKSEATDEVKDVPKVMAT